MLGAMASKEPLPATAQQWPLVGWGGDPWLPSSHLCPGAPKTDSPGHSSWPSSPAAFHPAPRGHFQPTSPDGAQGPGALSPKPVRRFFPPSWEDFFGRRWRRPGGERSPLTHAPGSQNCPLVTPALEGLQRTNFGGEDGASSSDKKDEEDCKKPPSDATTSSTSGRTVTATSQGGASTAPPGYKEKLEAYEHKYGYLKSWPGLLRLLGGLELILGGMVFACTAAYIQKDYEWSQLYGSSFLPYNGLTQLDYGYRGPMTPFVLVVASLVWLVTVILLGLGVTMYYRTILLNARWWPWTEGALNLLMFLLYLAAAITYVNDVNRGGLCYSAFVYNPVVVALCQVEGGQVAAVTFLFLTTLLYLTGSLICLKMWKHEAARRTPVPPRLILLPEASEHTGPQGSGPLPGRGTRRVMFSEEGGPEVPNHHAIPMGHNPKPLIVPDYMVRYPAITSLDQREKYKAIFNDQYSEYRELFHEIHATLQKFKELDALMSKLPAHPQNKEEHRRVSAVWWEYRSKKKDPAFLEKQERCQYLRKKLSHLKTQIQAFDADPSEPSLFF